MGYRASDGPTTAQFNRCVCLHACVARLVTTARAVNDRPSPFAFFATMTFEKEVALFGEWIEPGAIPGRKFDVSFRRCNLPFKKFTLAIHRASDSFLNVHDGRECLPVAIVDEFYTVDLKEVKITADTFKILYRIENFWARELKKNPFSGFRGIVRENCFNFVKFLEV